MTVDVAAVSVVVDTVLVLVDNGMCRYELQKDVAAVLIMGSETTAFTAAQDTAPFARCSRADCG